MDICSHSFLASNGNVRRKWNNQYSRLSQESYGILARQSGCLMTTPSPIAMPELCHISLNPLIHSIELRAIMGHFRLYEGQLAGKKYKYNRYIPPSIYFFQKIQIGKLHIEMRVVGIGLFGSCESAETSVQKIRENTCNTYLKTITLALLI